MVAKTVNEPIFLTFYVIIKSFFFSFFCQDTNITRSSCALICRNFSKKRKLALYQTQSGEPNYINHEILFLIFY